MVFLVDVSGSMSDRNKLPILKSSLKLLVNELKPTDHIALVTYAGNAGLVLKSTPVSEKETILKAIETVDQRLRKIGGTIFGISVGSKDGLKTEAELDDQAALLKQIRSICADNGIVANLHNHSYEVEYDMHDK